MRSEHRTRRFALVASLLLHAGLLALLFSLRAPPLPPAPDEPRPVDLEIVVTQPAPQPSPKPPPLPDASDAKTPPSVRPKVPAARREASAQPEAHPPAPPASSPEPAQPATVEAGSPPREPGDPGKSGAPTADRPARLSGGDLALAPTTDTARAMGMDTLDGPGLGTTVRRGDPKPDGSAARAQEAREVGKRVESMLADVQARHRVTTGGVDDYFGRMRESLAASTAKPPPGKRLSNPIGAAIESWTGGMERFGATGNPYREVEGTEIGADKRGEGLDALGEKIQRSNDLFEGEFGSDMVAVVEIWQAGTGGLLDWKLVASSGLREFDAYVMDAVPEAIAGLEPPPREGAGLHAEGIHSLWSFQGRIQYRTPLKAESYEETATNALFLVLGGSFEETTGEVWVNRVDKPQFLCRVRLLSVY